MGQEFIGADLNGSGTRKLSACTVRRAPSSCFHCQSSVDTAHSCTVHMLTGFFPFIGAPTIANTEDVQHVTAPSFAGSFGLCGWRGHSLSGHGHSKGHTQSPYISIAWRRGYRSRSPIHSGGMIGSCEVAACVFPAVQPTTQARGSLLRMPKQNPRPEVGCVGAATETLLRWSGCVCSTRQASRRNR